MDLDRIIGDLRECKIISEGDVQEMCVLMQELLIEEANVQRIDAPVTICGDIHGQLHDLLTLFEIGGEPPQSKYLFLGDFVDRGFYSVETVLLLFAYKLKYRDRVYLIRGNHESRQITSVYGFYDECVRKYSNANVWRYCCEVFDYLSLAAQVCGRLGGADGVFCVHGGLSPALLRMDELKVVDRKQEVPHSGAVCDLLWSDPDAEVEGWALSPRGAGFLFGRHETSKFLHLNRVSLVARAHQLVMEGYRELFDGGLVTVWSAPNYCYRCGNVAAILQVDDMLNREYVTFESNGAAAASSASTPGTAAAAFGFNSSLDNSDLHCSANIPTRTPVAEYFL